MVIVISVESWLLWAYLESAPALVLPKPPVKSLDSTISVRPLGLASARDPFRPASSVAAIPSDRSTTTPSKMTQSPNNLAAGTSKTVNSSESILARLGRLLNQAGKTAAQRASLVQEARIAVTGQVRLSATSVGGRRRVAVLNDRTIAEGEVLEGLSTLSAPVVLASVRPSSVLLRYREVLIEVAFPSTTTARSLSVAATRPPVETPKGKTTGRRGARKSGASR
jgi:hypothetical protein